MKASDLSELSKLIWKIRKYVKERTEWFVTNCPYELIPDSDKKILIPSENFQHIKFNGVKVSLWSEIVTISFTCHGGTSCSIAFEEYRHDFNIKLGFLCDKIFIALKEGLNQITSNMCGSRSWSITYEKQGDEQLCEDAPRDLEEMDFFQKIQYFRDQNDIYSLELLEDGFNALLQKTVSHYLGPLSCDEAAYKPLENLTSSHWPPFFCDEDTYNPIQSKLQSLFI